MRTRTTAVPPPEATPRRTARPVTGAASPDLAIDAQDLVKTYRADRRTDPIRALDGLSVSVAAGTVVALLGRNGAGKSTTVKVLTTLARPDSGRAVVAGLDTQDRPADVRRLIGIVGQKSSSDPMATGRENLVLAGRIQGLGRAAARARADELLDRFDLTDAGDRLARTYSGGMARKLDVAVGLVHWPQVLFLDEPTTGLDPEARARMWEEINRLSADEHTTVLLTTHYLEEADRLADRVAIVDRGRVVVEGTPDELKSDLHGDTVSIELAPASESRGADACEVLGRVSGLFEPAFVGARVRARAANAAQAVPAVLAAFEAAHLDVSAVGVARPTLDDVYRRHVGRTFTDEVAA